MSDQTQARLTRQPVFLFVVATAMATTVATLAATALVKAETPRPSVVCECAAPEAAAVDKAVPEAPATESPAAKSEAAAPEPEPQPQIPHVRQAQATVDGPMDKDIIRRIVRAHINEVRYCYNQGLEQNPELAGRVVVRFEIGAQGKVEESTVASSDLDSDEVSECIAGAVQRWKFPKARDGQSVLITYPFVLEPG